MKFGRTYKMSIQGELLKWTPEFPTTLEFDIQRNTFSSANKGTFTLYNLNAAARRDIYFDRYINDRRLELILQAGYVGSPVLPTIFKGDIRVAWTERRGPDWVTQIEAFDGGWAFYNAQASGLSLPPTADDETMQKAATALVSTMTPFGVTLGKVSKINISNKFGLPFSNSAWDELKNIVPGDAQLFVDNGVCNILNPNDYLPTKTIPSISAENGLLGTPRKQGNLTTARMIFDPQYFLGQLAGLYSGESWLNSPKLKVMGVHHYGKISGSQNGDLITELALFSGYQSNQLFSVDSVTEEQFA